VFAGLFGLGSRIVRLRRWGLNGTTASPSWETLRKMLVCRHLSMTRTSDLLHHWEKAEGSTHGNIATSLNDARESPPLAQASWRCQRPPSMGVSQPPKRDSSRCADSRLQAALQ
jgi:hypothetical protein